jgi:cytochrome c5
MSQAPGHAAEEFDPEEGHTSPIRTPKQLIVTIVLSFVLPVIIIILLVNNVVWRDKGAAGTAALDEDSVGRRITPVARVMLRDASAAAAVRTGEQVYQGVCSACHAAGAAGAPKLGDAPAWAPRVKTGFEALLNSALKGKGAMAPQGGGDYSDYEIARAVVYLANKGGASFEEPKAPAAAASAASAAN